MATENKLKTGGPAIDGIAASAPDTTLLSVDGLTVAYGDQTVVHDVSFELARGESLALIGESGSGKTTIARTVLRLLPPEARVSAGQILFNRQDIAVLGERQFRPLRGRELGFVPQDPSNALNAVRTIGSQALEAAALLPDGDAAARRERVLETFRQVGLTDPDRVLRSYPHQLSGGMLQRVLIGLAVLPRPALIVADEPTSGLDVTIQKRILDLFNQLKESLGIGVLFITHDLAVAAERADSLVVLKDGVVQERGPAARVFAAPTSEYARELQADVPAVNPDRYRAIDSGQTQSQQISGASQIEVRSLSKTFTVGARAVRALDDVSFSVRRGSTHALVGESGSGKTTAARLLARPRAPRRGRDHHRRSVGPRPLPRSVAHAPPPPAARLPEPVHLARPDLAAGPDRPRAARPLPRRRQGRTGRPGGGGA